MRKLLIVDPTLVSLEGHSYNYGRAIFGAAREEFPVLVARMVEDPGRYRADVRRFSKLWRRTHNPDSCVEAMLAIAA